MLDQLSFRLNERIIKSSYLEIAERIESSDRVSPFIKRLKQDSGKEKLFREQITNAMTKEFPRCMEHVRGKGLKR